MKGFRTIDFRYKILRNGADYGYLFPAEEGAPQLHMDSGSVIKTSFSGDFLEPSKDFNILADDIAPVLIIDEEPYQLGVFRAVHASTHDNGYYKTVHLEAYDHCWLVNANRLLGYIFFGAGTNYIDAIGSLLASCGITRIYSTPTSEELTEDREWIMGTSYIDVVNQLLGEINYNDLWFDSNGFAHLEPYSPTNVNKAKHVLDDTKIESIMLPGLTSEFDVYDRPNVFICVCSNADKDGAMVAVAENTNPTSPLSIHRRPRIAQVINVDNIASQEALQSFAKRQVTESLLAVESISVQTGLLPGFGVYDTTALKYGDLMEICRETSWTMDLKVGGLMTHELKRVVLNVDI